MNEPVFMTQIVMKAPATDPLHVPTKGDIDALTPEDVGAAAVIHGHAVSDVEDLQSELDAKADATDLSVYALSADVDAGLTAKADFAALADYALKTDLSSGLSTKADASALSAYLTKADAANALAEKADASSLEDYVTEVDLDAELAYKADLVSGKIKVSQLPPGVVPTNYTVAAEADLVTLTDALVNDRALVTDTAEIWLLWSADPTVATNWQNITATAEAAPVSSVNNMTGAVTLDLEHFPNVQNSLDDKANASDLSNYATTSALSSGLSGKAGTAAATSSANGLMSASDKLKLDGIAAGAQVNSVTSVSGKTGAVTLAAADVGLGSVNNTADSAKPISTATQAALNLKAAITTVPKMYSSSFKGTGSAAAFTVTHNLGTNKVSVQTFDASGNIVVFGVQVTSASAVKLTAATAPAATQTFTVVVIGIP